MQARVMKEVSSNAVVHSSSHRKTLGAYNTCRGSGGFHEVTDAEEYLMDMAAFSENPWMFKQKPSRCSQYCSSEPSVKRRV